MHNADFFDKLFFIENRLNVSQINRNIVYCLKRDNIVRKLVYLFFASVCMAVSVTTAYAQDPYFSQYYANPLYLNPAMAGTSWCPRFVTNYRNQFPAFEGNFVTYSASYDQNIESIGGGVGVQVFHDRMADGIMTNNEVNLMYSYHYAINRRFSMRAALSVGYFMKTLDGSRLTFPDMIDPRYGFIYTTQDLDIFNNTFDRPQGLDFGAGVLGYSKKFYGGFAVDHLLEPDDAFSGFGSVIPRKYTIHAGALIPLERDFKDVSISPNFVYQKQQNFSTANLGMYFTKEPFVGGVWYRNAGIAFTDAFIVLIGLEQINKNGPQFKVGYTFDITIGGVGIGNTSGAHELSLSYVFPCRKKPKRWRTISCPSF